MRGARGHLGRHAPNSKKRSTMVSSMGGNVGDGKVVDSKHVASKGEDVGDNGGMTCEAKVSSGVEVLGGMKVSGGMKLLSDMEVSSGVGVLVANG